MAPEAAHGHRSDRGRAECAAELAHQANTEHDLDQLDTVTAFVTDQRLALSLLIALGLPAEPATFAPARDPPQAELVWDEPHSRPRRRSPVVMAPVRPRANQRWPRAHLHASATPSLPQLPPPASAPPAAKPPLNFLGATRTSRRTSRRIRENAPTTAS